MCLVAWDKVCNLKMDRGLGLKNVEVFNLALLSKWRWRFINNFSARWRPLLHHRYKDVRNIFTGCRALRGSSKELLWWRDMLRMEGNLFPALNAFSSGLRPVLGDGSDISFLHHCWLSNNPLKVDFLFELEKMKEGSVQDHGI